MSDKDKYKYYTKNNNDIPIFSRPWWLDAVSDEGHWDVILYEKNNNIYGSLPFFIKKKNIFKLSILPRLTQKLGPYFADGKFNDNEKIFSYLSKKLPYTNYFDQNCHHTINNQKIFINEGFTVKNMRTCIIEDIKNINEIRNNFSKNRRYDLSKAKENNLNTNFNVNPNLFYEEHVKNLKKRGLKINYSKNFLIRLFDACSENKSGKLIGVYDNSNNYLALCFIVWDDLYAYLIGLTTNSDNLKTGASSLLIFNSINYLIGKTKNFDFEGSMDENIYKFYNSFGTITKNYFKIKSIKPSFMKVFLE